MDEYDFRMKMSELKRYNVSMTPCHNNYYYKAGTYSKPKLNTQILFAPNSLHDNNKLFLFCFIVTHFDSSFKHFTKPFVETVTDNLDLNDCNLKHLLTISKLNTCLKVTMSNFSSNYL